MQSLMLTWRRDSDGVETSAIFEAHTPETAAEIVTSSIRQNDGTYTLIGVETA